MSWWLIKGVEGLVCFLVGVALGKGVTWWQARRIKRAKGQ